MSKHVKRYFEQYLSYLILTAPRINGILFEASRKEIFLQIIGYCHCLHDNELIDRDTRNKLIQKNIFILSPCTEVKSLIKKGLLK